MDIRELDHVSFTSMNVLLRCSHKFGLRYIQKVRSQEPIPDYMHVGKVVDNALLFVHNKITLGFDSMLEENGIEFNDEKWYHFCLGIWKTREMLYDEVYGGIEDLELQKVISFELINKETGEIICNEKGKMLRATGYLDAYSRLLNKIYEVKTGDPKMLEEYAFKGQTQLYCLGIMEEYGVDTPGVEYIFIKKPRLRLRKDETEESFNQRWFEAGLDAEVIKKPIPYKKDSLIETARYIIDVVQDNVEFVPTKNRNECIRFNDKCEYFSLCWPDAFALPEIKKEEVA